MAERSRESVDSVRSLLDGFASAIRAVVVATDDVLLVCPKDRAADVGKLVKRLAKTDRADYV